MVTDLNMRSLWRVNCSDELADSIWYYEAKRKVPP